MLLNTELTLRYNFHRHYISGSHASDIIQVSDTLIGLHSARLISPYAALISRLEDFRPEHLYHEVVSKGTLIKLRCMRKTLHTLSMELASIAHNATLSYRIAGFHSCYKKLPCKENQIIGLKEKILHLLREDSLPASTIVNTLNSHYDPALINLALRELWERGTVCYINESNDWQREKRKYGLTKRCYPLLDLHDLPEQVAQQLLIIRYIESYGPVTLGDISWWSALPGGKIIKIIKENAGRILPVRMTGFNQVFYVTDTTIEEIKNSDLPETTWIKLLAHEDPTLKGYFETRSRYVDDKFYQFLFNPIGEARASIVKNGKVIGIWAWNKKESGIDHQLFKKLNKGEMRLLMSEKEKVSRSLKNE